MDKSYLHFVLIVDSKLKTKQFYIMNSSQTDILGYILFYPAWRKFVFKSYSSTCIFDSVCLKEIMEFCDKQTLGWREEVKARQQTKEGELK